MKMIFEWQNYPKSSEDAYSSEGKIVLTTDSGTTILAEEFVPLLEMAERMCSWALDSGSFSYSPEGYAEEPMIGISIDGALANIDTPDTRAQGASIKVPLAELEEFRRSFHSSINLDLERRYGPL
jgi:hypothetical protein